LASADRLIMKLFLKNMKGNEYTFNFLYASINLDDFQ
jgi:hypothetical protein